MDNSEKEWPLVTFLSPSYNHSRYIIESLDSIRLQTYPNIEHIIIDDCSTDDSVSKIENWIRKYNCRCIFIKHSQNAGTSYTLNEGIELAKGTYFTSLATDDIAIPERTARFVDYLEKSDKVPMVVSDTDFINSDSVRVQYNGYDSFTKFHTSHRPDFKLEEYGTYSSLLRGNYIASSIMIRTSIFQKAGRFNTSLMVEDWDMWLRISIIGQIKYIDEYLSSYRMHGANTLNTRSKRMKKEYVRVLLQQKPIAYKEHLGFLFNVQIKVLAEIYLEDKNYGIVAALLLKGNFLMVGKMIARKILKGIKKSLKLA
jgi:glycosyltransferase involved in cell wall biosynthesis